MHGVYEPSALYCARVEGTNHRRFRLPSVPVMVAIVGALLGIQALLSIFGTLSSFLGRFSQAFLLFAVGAIAAYVLLPSVDWVQHRLRRRSAAIATIYLVVTV